MILGTSGTLVTNASDVTERRRLDQMLADKDARMRLAMDAANYGDWEWDRRSGALTLSDKMRELLGIAADEPISFKPQAARSQLGARDSDRRDHRLGPG